MALVTLMAALVVSVPSGKLSDVIGRKIPIIIAFLFIMSVFISWIFVRTFTAVLLTGECVLTFPLTYAQLLSMVLEMACILQYAP